MSGQDTYGSVTGVGLRRRLGPLSARRAAVQMVGVVLVLAAVALVSVGYVSKVREIALREYLAIGPLGRTHSDSENILGSLAITPDMDDDDAIRHQQARRHAISNAAATFHNKAKQFSNLQRTLHAEEAKVRRMEAAEERKYEMAARAARHAKPQRAHWSSEHSAKSEAAGFGSIQLAAPAHQESNSTPRGNAMCNLNVLFCSQAQPSTAEEAQKVANIVLSALKPQLSVEQSEISKLANLVTKSRSAKKAPAQSSEEETFQSRMSQYLHGAMRAATSGLNMIDYRLGSDLEHDANDPGLGAEPALRPELGIKATRPRSLTKNISYHSIPWHRPSAKGGPCSTAGACNHGQYHFNQEEAWREHFVERYTNWSTDGSGGPVRHQAPYHPIETHLAIKDQPSGEAVVKALDFAAADVTKNIPGTPSKDFVVSVDGNVKIAQGGKYTFCVSSSDRSVLFVNNRKVVNNDGRPDRGSLLPEEVKCGDVVLPAGLYPVRAVSFQATKPISFAATYSGKDTSEGKKAVESKGWVMRVVPSLPSLWDKWYVAYSVQQRALLDGDLMMSPIGECLITKKDLKGKDMLKGDIQGIPDKNFFVTLIGSVEVKTSGPYYFCSPGKEGTVLYVDDRKVLNCLPPTSDATERCGTLHLLRGTHSVKAAVQGALPDDKGDYFTYSGKDTEYEPAALESARGWVLRAFRAPEATFRKWYHEVCARPREFVSLGDEEMLPELDDFIPTNDAYVHDQLTSGNYGYDHFGNLEPLSRENQVMMYGNDFQSNLRQIVGKRLHSPGRGGAGKHADKPSGLGDDQIDNDDREVPVGLSTDPFPGMDPDRFDHWPSKSAQNQELLNGRYWKHLKRDGLMDRLTPADEAYSQISGTSHDRHPIADLAVGSWNVGVGRGPSVWGSPSLFLEADRRLTSDKVGQTTDASPDLAPDSAIHKALKKVLPKKDFVQLSTGVVRIVRSGTYKFCADGPENPSMLFVDGSLPAGRSESTQGAREAGPQVADNADGKNKSCGEVALAAGPHRVRLAAFQKDPAGQSKATYSGPDTVEAKKEDTKPAGNQTAPPPQANQTGVAVAKMALTLQSLEEQVAAAAAAAAAPAPAAAPAGGKAEEKPAVPAEKALAAEDGFLLRAYRVSDNLWEYWAGVHRMSPTRAAFISAERNPEPWIADRQRTLGKEWRRRVFTGTHERVEDHRGIVQNNLYDDGAYF